MMRLFSLPEIRSIAFTAVLSLPASSQDPSCSQDDLEHFRSYPPDPVAAECGPARSGHAVHHGGGHAPIGVKGDHVHARGEIMFSYRPMIMDMDGNRDGTNRLSTADVFARGYVVSPLEMTMEMHMFGAMYAWTDSTTLMAMVPYVRLSMDHLTGMGGRFTTRSKGIGDVKLTGLHTLWESGVHRVHGNLGASLPTGSIDERDETPMSGGAEVQLPYPMQLGSGTFDLLPGITYSGHTEDWSWGAQLGGTIRLGENTNDYRLGDRLETTGWVTKLFDNDTGISLRLAGADWGNIDGADSELNPMMVSIVPTADPNLRGGTRVDALAGLSWFPSAGWAEGHRLSLEFGVPVYQDLDGPQLETDTILSIGWQYLR